MKSIIISLRWLLPAAILSLFALTLTPSPARCAEDKQSLKVEVPSGIDHGKFDALLKKYVDAQGLVNYTAWKGNADDMAALSAYLKQFAPKAEKPAAGNEKSAALVNAYNASVLHWILENYPTESIWETKDAFTAKRFPIGGQQVALNDIENGTLRPAIGVKAHSVLVCAARSCPPLQRNAYTAGDFEAQDTKAYHIWLGREDLNKFEPEKKKAEVSSIFKFYKEDFEKAGGVKKVLGQYAPEKDKAFLTGGDYEVSYLSYNWGLNDQGEHGRKYSKLDLLIDKLTN